MAKIYTGAGDIGNTRLRGRGSVAKDDIRIEVIGTLDELNSHLGVVIAADPDPDIMKILTDIQKDIFSISADIASPENQRRHTVVDDLKIKYMEEIIDIFDKDLPVLQNFILPGGMERAARLQVARSVCRRAERRFVTIMHKLEMNGIILVYLNRLSDLLFVLARTENHRGGIKDSLWSAGNE
jgi:cob(I)alamin adenosyltransferase